jgi:hypothetical protein
MSHLLSIADFCVENQFYKKGGSLSLPWVAGVASISTFETLSNLHIPAAAEFQNAEIREEFRKLTEKLKND